MADREEDDDLQMALRMSLESSPPPEPSRSKPVDIPGESPEARDRRVQREVMAAAAEKRMQAMAVSAAVAPKAAVKEESVVAQSIVAEMVKEESVVAQSIVAETAMEVEAVKVVEETVEDLGEELSEETVAELYLMVFGRDVSREILAQWSNQGIKFSSDPETTMGLVQHEGGPCGVLAAIQAFVLKNLLFSSEDRKANNPPPTWEIRRYSQSSNATTDVFASLTEDRKKRALVRSLVEILFLCGSRQRAVVVTLSPFRNYSACESEDGQIAKCLEGLSVESASDLQKVLRVKTYTSKAAAFQRLMSELPVLQSRMGAMLFLISALLSRGLHSVQADRDDPSQPLVTAPFGHASQEIVNLLLCGQAVPNVFDDKMDLGGGMFVKGIPTNVEVGFLTLLEYLNFCRVGQYLKCPKYPIWVVGSESHYTVLFALDPSVQEENEAEQRESKIRAAFEARDQSGGGGFIGAEELNQVLSESNIYFPQEKLSSLTSSDFIVWSEFWQALLDLERSRGGFKDSTGLRGRKEFDIYHFNGIAKSVINGDPLQKPRLCKMRVTVPPRWDQDEYMADVVPISGINEPAPKHAPLVDCVRTRWPRAACSWAGDTPSIV